MKFEDGQLVQGFCWIPRRNKGTVMRTLTDLKESNPANLEMPRVVKLDPADYMEITPPTLFVTNEFTEPFQMITD